MGWIHANEEQRDYDYESGRTAPAPGSSPNSGELPGERRNRLVRENALKCFGGRLVAHRDADRDSTLERMVLGRSGNAVPLRRCANRNLTSWYDIIVTEGGAYIPALDGDVTDQDGRFVPAKEWTDPEKGGVGRWMFRRWAHS